LESIKNRENRTVITQLIVDIIIYIHKIYNVDAEDNIPEVKQFEYMLKSTTMFTTNRDDEKIKKSLDTEEEAEEKAELEYDRQQEMESIDLPSDYYDNTER
jgi:hypothetical protein